MKPETDDPNKEKHSGAWEALDYQGCRIGFYISEPGDVNRPRAFISTTSGNEQVARKLALEIADDPDKTWQHYQENAVIDLIDFGWPDSRRPMPGFIYGLQCWPLGGDGKLIPGSVYYPRPYCKFMIAELLDVSPDQPSGKDEVSQDSGCILGIRNGKIVTKDGERYWWEDPTCELRVEADEEGGVVYAWCVMIYSPRDVEGFIADVRVGPFFPSEEARKMAEAIKADPSILDTPHPYVKDLRDERAMSDFDKIEPRYLEWLKKGGRP